MKIKKIKNEFIKFVNKKKEEWEEERKFNKTVNKEAKLVALAERKRQIIKTAKYKEKVKGDTQRKSIKQNKPFTIADAILGEPKKGKKKDSLNDRLEEFLN